MKKLMIAAAIVCAAAVSHGALAQWGLASNEVAGPAGSVYTDEDGYLTGGTIFLYVGDYVTASDSAFKFGTADYITKGTIDSSYYWGSPLESVEVPNLTNTAKDQKFSLILVDQEIEYTDLAKYEGNYVIYSGLSAQGTIADSQGGATTYYGMFLDKGSTYEGSWQTMAVPEPTSGLLLLFGIAGLALRRRRA